MKYVNGFSINAVGAECFITLLQSHPKPGSNERVYEEVDTLVMSENCARQFYNAMKDIYEKMDSDRASRKRTPDFKKDSNVKLS